MYNTDFNKGYNTALYNLLVLLTTTSPLNNGFDCVKDADSECWSISNLVGNSPNPFFYFTFIFSLSWNNTHFFY